PLPFPTRRSSDLVLRITRLLRALRLARCGGRRSRRCGGRRSGGRRVGLRSAAESVTSDVGHKNLRVGFRLAVVIDGPDLETLLGVGTRHHAQEVSLLPARNPRGHEDLVRNPAQLVLDGAVTLSVRGARGGPDVLLVVVGL